MSLFVVPQSSLKGSAVISSKWGDPDGVPALQKAPSFSQILLFRVA